MKNEISTLIGALIIWAIVAPALYEKTRHIIRYAKIKLFGLFDAYVKDTKIKAAIIAKMLKLQKEMTSENGKTKLRIVIDFAKTVLPGGLDDAIIEKLVQAIYDEVVYDRS